MADDNGERYVASKVEFVASPCDTCKRRNVEFPDRCEAFPAGIPNVIIGGENTHEEPYPGDNGLTYEPVDVLPDTWLDEEEA